MTAPDEATPVPAVPAPRGRGRIARTPALLQFEAVECGAAALGMILEHHGRFVPLAELRRECGVSRDGSKASNMLKAAQKYGLTAKGWKKELASLFALAPPFIVFWNFNHFVVVEGFRKGRAFLNDPAHGHRSVSMEEFDGSFTGVVLVFEPGPEFRKGGRRPSLWPALFERLRNAKAAVLYCFLAGLLLAFIGLAIPAFTQIYLDRVLGEGRKDWLRPLLVALLATAALKVVLDSLKFRFLRRLKVHLAVGMSSRFFWHLLRLPLGFYSQRYSGEIASRTRLNDNLAEIMSGRLADTAISVVMMAGYVALMAHYDLLLTGIGIGAAAVDFLALKLIARRRVEANMRLREHLGRVDGVTVAALQGMETIKSAGQESAFFSRWAGHHARALNSQQALEATHHALGVVPVFLSSLTTVFILLIGGGRVISGHLSIGMLVAFQALMRNFLDPVKDLVNLGSTLQELEGDLRRVDDVLAYPPDAEAAASAPAAPPPSEGAPLRLRGSLEIQDLTFGYGPLDPPVIRDFSLSVPPGRRIALVGGSGSGKTTIANLVGGLYAPWSGRILFDGAPRREVPRPVMINSFSMVGQETFLFEGTVRENLTLWDPTIPDASLVKACEDAAILDEVLSLPQGLDARILEGGANLSGGQRQRLEIARSLVHDPSILVLDEATSALDAETERLIDERLRLRGCTCLIVAHRLSTIRDCDEIIVLEKGRVVERGTHDALWAAGGVYTGLLAAGGSLVGSGS